MLWWSPLTRIHIAIADSSVLPYCFLSLWEFCQAVLLLTYVIATKLGGYPELDQWNIIHILGFITRNFLPTSLMIMSAL